MVPDTRIQGTATVKYSTDDVRETSVINGVVTLSLDDRTTGTTTVQIDYKSSPDDYYPDDRKERLGNNRRHQPKSVSQRKRKLAAASRKRNRK